ncbi:TetR/AcrR family transcriptional regulator [Oleomonas cavernae]|uniref:TetR/AcrR family transcriptional regulator n=1 Tax=Oleomonas cavernae TaxID=2320859 RepID=A0A418WGV7_9PROT|nr:TetR/AcrR family transcriptional regulator [Oleomonas cavernae]RJF89286.1 TetR/AcrR family transcriptional regulator [Oleomonas cavernae]
MRKKPVQQRSKATTIAIVEAASMILRKDDHIAFTTNDIARRAGVSIGSLYQFFPNKEAILTAVIASWVDAIASEIDEIPSGGDGSGPQEAIGSLVTALFDVAERHEREIHVVAKHIQLAAEIPAVKALPSKLFGKFAAIRGRDADDRGLAGNGPIDFVLASTIFWILIRAALSRQPETGHDRFDQEISALIARVLLDGEEPYASPVKDRPRPRTTASDVVPHSLLAKHHNRGAGRQADTTTK